MRKRKILALLLALALMAALMAGCAREDVPAPETPASEAPAPSEPSAEAPAEDAAPAEDSTEEAGDEPAPEEAPADPGIISGYTEIGTPIVSYVYDLPLVPEGEDISFSIWASTSDGLTKYLPNGYADCIGYQASAEMTGITIDFTTTSSTVNAEKFNLMIASQDYVDIITNITMLWSSGYDYAIEEEIFIDLNDILGDMPVYSALYEQLDDDVKRDLHTDSGNFPVLYSLNYDFAAQSEGPMIRRDYLEKVGMEIPSTYDELDAVLRAFKTELDLPQPLMLPKGIVHTANSLCSGFGVLGTFSAFPMVSEPYYQVDGEVKYGVVEPGFKEYMEMISGWYAEGIISSEFMVLNDNPMGSTYTSEISGGNAGVFFADGAMIENYITVGTSTDPNYDIWAIPDPVKEEGQINHFLTKKSPISGRLSNIVVTTAAENLDILAKYLDWHFTDAGSLMATGGPEGRAWEYDADGNKVRTEEWETSDVPKRERGNVYAFSAMPMLTREDMPEEETYPVQEAAGPIWEANADSAYVMPTTLSISTEESERYAKIYNDIQTYIDENLARFVTGENSMDEWDAFVDQIMAMGLEDCIAIKQAALDRYYERAVD